MKMKFNITGLDCPNCAAKLASQMEKLEGIESAKINFLTERLTVEAALGEEETYARLVAAARAFSKDIVIEK